MDIVQIDSSQLTQLVTSIDNITTEIQGFRSDIQELRTEIQYNQSYNVFLHNSSFWGIEMIFAFVFVRVFSVAKNQRNIF